MFQKAIQANGEKWDADIVNLFHLTLRYANANWGKNFMQSHPGCTFLELETTFCKRYCTVQNDE